jgi:hypothetical protein
VFGSRLPVGSSATSIGGWETKGPGYRDALLLAAGEHVRVLVHLPREADQVEDLGHLGADGAALLARYLHRVGDVLGGRLVREQLEVLEDAPDVAPEAAVSCAAAPKRASCR